MPKLLFFSRVALICNACFLISFLLHYMPLRVKELVPSTVIIMGYVLALVINITLNLLILILALAGKFERKWVPRWLLLINFLFFVLQAILLIK